MDYVYYVGFYSKLDNPNNFHVFPAINTKMDYIKSAIKKADFKITLFALGEAQTKKRHIFKRRTEIVDNQEKIIYVNTFGRPSAFYRIISRFWLLFQLFYFLSFEVKKGSTVIYYHSFATIMTVKLSRFFNKYKLIFEVEEIFQAAWKGSIKKIENEVKYLKNADAYILVNDLIASKCGFDTNPFAVCYGDYRSMGNLNNKKSYINDSINIVYAGVIGDKNSDVYLSIETMNFLPNNYLLHILGYGIESDTVQMKIKISEMNKYFKYDKIIYHGSLFGEEYTNFLSTCQIGLSTRVLEDKYSDFTFPSKVLVYLCNNLITISSPISCIMKSKISDSIFFYEQSTPQSVSEKILSINPNEFNKSNNDLLGKLDDSFVNQLKEIFNKIKI
jgi:hypothetical protein